MAVPVAFELARDLRKAPRVIALELAAAATPHVIAYRANALTAMVVRRMVRIDTASPVNLVAGRRVTPELLQEACTPTALAQALGTLMGDRQAIATQKAAMHDVMAALGRGGPPPSARAADAVLELIGPAKG